MERIYLTAENATITRTDLALVTLTLADGRTFENLEPRRLFPVTNVQTYITLLDSDEREVALVRDLADLDGASRKALEDCFGEFYRVPNITRILEIRARFGSLTFVVETNCGGPVTFRIRNRHSDIKTLRGGRILVCDSNDNRYVIVSLAALDKNSRRLLFPYL